MAKGNMHRQMWKQGQRAIQRTSRFYGDDFDIHSCEVVERNGNLTLVRDSETGEESWRAPHELSR